MPAAFGKTITIRSRAVSMSYAFRAIDWWMTKRRSEQTAGARRPVRDRDTGVARFLRIDGLRSQGFEPVRSMNYNTFSDNKLPPKPSSATVFRRPFGWISADSRHETRKGKLSVKREFSGIAKPWVRGDRSCHLWAVDRVRRGPVCPASRLCGDHGSWRPRSWLPSVGAESAPARRTRGDWI